jgi:hypothetical protein
MNQTKQKLIFISCSRSPSVRWHLGFSEVHFRSHASRHQSVRARVIRTRRLQQAVGINAALVLPRVASQTSVTRRVAELRQAPLDGSTVVGVRRRGCGPGGVGIRRRLRQTHAQLRVVEIERMINNSYGARRGDGSGEPVQFGGPV